jgi:hypothetical protein
MSACRCDPPNVALPARDPNDTRAMLAAFSVRQELYGLGVVGGTRRLSITEATPLLVA